MRRSRLTLMIVLMGGILLGAYWVVGAQETRPLFPPPTVVAPDSLPVPAVTKGVEKKAQPASGKPRADATLIIPAEAYDVPRLLQAEDRKPGVLGVVQLEDRLPAPMFPAELKAPEPKDAKAPITPMPLPGLETQLLISPTPEPTKLLIVEPAKKEALPKNLAASQLPMPSTEKPPVVIPEPKHELILPPPVIVLDANKGPAIPPPTPPMPTLIAEPKKDPIVPPPTLIPPPTVLPEAPQVPVTPPQPTETPRAFERIKSASSEPPPSVAPPDPIKIGRPAPDKLQLESEAEAKRFSSPPLPAANGIGLSSLLTVQTPNVTVEKRGSSKMRAQEANGYVIVVRNLGPGAAQQVRIEDELPANVKIVFADPMPTMEGNKAVWVLSTVNVNQEQTIRLTLQATSDTDLTGRTSVHVAAMAQTTTSALRLRNDALPLAIQFTGPDHAAVGKPVVFVVRVANQSDQPLSGIVLHGFLSEGLTSPAGQTIVGDVDGTIPVGDFKILKMPATAVKPGRYAVSVKVVTGAGEASATAAIDIAAETSLLQQVPSTRLLVGRDGDLRVELTNNTGKPLRNVTIADRLPEGLDFIAAGHAGLYQSNSRTVYWLISQMPVGKTETLVVRVNGARAGEQQHVVFAKADGVPEMTSTGAVAVEGLADLSLRVTSRDDLLEQGKETTYEIVVQNPGSAPAHNVQLQVQLSAGMTAKNAQGNTRFKLDRQTIVFEPIASLEPKGQAVFRVSAIGQSLGDQRVRCAIVSDQVRVPIQREVSTRVVER